MRKLIYRKSVPVSLFDIFDGETPDTAMANLKTLCDELNRLQFQDCDTSITFDIAYTGYDGGVELNYRIFTYETDKEYNTRLKTEADERKRTEAADAKRLDKDRKLYEKLKKKFEPNAS